MGQKRKADDMITYWEWNFLCYMAYKFRRLLTWNAMINDAVDNLPLAMEPADAVEANQPVEEIEDVEMN